MKAREISLKEVSDILSLDFTGPNNIIASLSYADVKSEGNAVLSFCNTMNYLRHALRNGNIKALFCTVDIYDKLSQGEKKAVSYFLVEDPASTFYYLHNFLYEKTIFYKEWEFRAKIGKNCKIHSTGFIDEGVIVGDNVAIGPNTSILKGAKIGDCVKIDANTVIGAEGNATNYYVNGKLTHIHHAGGVEVGDYVTIGSQTLVSRNVMAGRLYIGSGSQIDNRVHIGHNSIIGERCVISAGSIICGNVTVEEDCYFAPGTIVRDKVHIGQGVVTHLGSVVVENVDKGTTVAGFYAMPHFAWLMKTKDDRKRYLRRN